VMRESNYKRIISQQYFLPLKWFDWERGMYLSDNEQRQFAEKIAENYQLHPGNVLRLITYAERALVWALKSEQPINQDDVTNILVFDENPKPIAKVKFYAGDGSVCFILHGPYLIDQLYHTAYNELNKIDTGGNVPLSAMPVDAMVAKNSGYISGKKRPSGNIIKEIGTEIFNELTNVEKLTDWNAECILGRIMGFYRIGLKVDKPTKTEQEYIKFRRHHPEKPTYISYCQDVGKRCHN